MIFFQAVQCEKSPGLINEDGTDQPSSQHNIYMDDSMMADTFQRIPQVIASAVDAFFTIMGVSMLHLRQCAVAMDKWKYLVVSYQLVLLGLSFNTREMTVSITDEYCQEVLKLLDTAWRE